jgi:hypothetical protein
MDLLRNLTSNGNPTSPLTVDTSVAKVFTSSNGSPRWQDESRTPSPTATTPSSTSSEEQFLRRRRSNSECLLLAKNRGGHELPGPCQEYISSIKQILARSEDSHRRDLTGIAQRHRSMSLKNSPTMKEQVIR